MSIPVANITIATGTFDTFIVTSNTMANIISNYVLTTASNSIGGSTTGNAVVNGYFGANTLVAQTLIGGIVGTSANLNISSNLVVNTNVLCVYTSGNVGIGSISPNATLYVSGNANVTGNVWIGGSTTIGSKINILTNFTIDVATNTNLGVSLSTPLIVYSFSNTYSVVKFIGKAKNGNTVQATEMLLVQDGANAFMTEYSTVVAQPGINVGSWDAQVNVGGNIELAFSQVLANTSITVIAELIN
jgi:hypothetical protein